MTEAGRVVVLNGTSSAGKTTIARAFRARRAAAGDFWLLVGIDDVLSKLPAEWLDLGLPIGRGRYAADGLRLESTAAGPDLRVGVHCALDVAEARERRAPCRPSPSSCDFSFDGLAAPRLSTARTEVQVLVDPATYRDHWPRAFRRV